MERQQDKDTGNQRIHREKIIDVPIDPVPQCQGSRELGKEPVDPRHQRGHQGRDKHDQRRIKQNQDGKHQSLPCIPEFLLGHHRENNAGRQPLVEQKRLKCHKGFGDKC